MSIVIRGKRFASLNDPVFVGDRRIRKIMVGIEQVYPIPTQYFALYAQWILFPEMVSGYGPHPVDQYGAMLKFNEGARVTKCCVFLDLYENGTIATRTFGIRGTGIERVRYVPFLADHGELVYDGDTTEGINTYDLTLGDAGYWRIDYINANLETAGGGRISSYSSSYDSKNVRIVYSKEAFESYLSSD